MSADAALTPSDSTVALLSVGCLDDPNAWSGIPASLRQALGSRGVRAISAPVTARATRRDAPRLATEALFRAGSRPTCGTVRRAAGQAGFGPSATVGRGKAAARACDTTAPDAAILLSNEFLMPDGVPFVTYEDQTLAQARRAGIYPHIDALGQRTIQRRIDLQRRNYSRATACCVFTDAARQSLIEDYDVSPARALVVGFGANHVVPAPSDRDWSTPHFLFVGVDFKRKNGPRVLAAFQELRAAVPRAQLHVVGGHPPIDSPGVRGYGHLQLSSPGDAAVMARLFKQATCFVMPSLFEPAGIVYAEAAHSGVASIASIRGGAATVVRESGLLVEPTDEHSITSAMRAFADGAFARERGALALASAHEFTWPKTCDRLLAALALREVRGDEDRRR